MDAIRTWRADGIPVYYTIDAGPNVHIICESKNEERLVKMIGKISGISRIVINAPSVGAHLVNDHLF
jgi:diphosphomevalonate decarboxylase